jgi:hypothetical protein
MRLIPLSLLCTLAMLALLAGCVQTQQSEFVRNHKALRVNDPIYNIHAVRLSDGTVKLSFVGSATLRTKGRYVKYVEAKLGPTEEEMNDIVMFSMATAGAPGVNETVHLVGTATWDTKAAMQSTSCWADVGVVTPTEHLVFRVHLDYEDVEPMELDPFTMAVNDTTVDIGVIAKRIFVPPGEYLPSSETFRVIISDANGYVVFRTDYERNYLQLVTDVEPLSPNQMHRYASPWNGRDLQGNVVPFGKYKCELIIPAFPKPYRTECEVEWPPR